MAQDSLNVLVELTPELKAEVEALVRARMTIGYGVLVRHPGFIDRLLPAEGYDHYPTDSINHWLCGPDRDPMRFDDESCAQQLADELTAKFGGDNYRFTVAVCRPVPRWFIAHPKTEMESAPIGTWEQTR
jgi:hypothetical protein